MQSSVLSVWSLPAVLCCAVRWLLLLVLPYQALAIQAELEGMQQVQDAAADTQQALQECAAALQDMQQLQQGLQAAIADARQKATAAAAEVQSEGSSSTAAPASTAAPTTEQREQQEQQAVLPEFDSAAAEAALQPLVQAEQEASQQLQQQRGAVQDLQGQLKAAKARRTKYARLQGAAAGAGYHSSSKVTAAHDSGTVANAAGSHMQPVCEQCLQPINVELYQRWERCRAGVTAGSNAQNLVCCH